MPICMRILSDNVREYFVSITGPRQQHCQEQLATKAKKNKGQHAMQDLTHPSEPWTKFVSLNRPPQDPM